MDHNSLILFSDVAPIASFWRFTKKTPPRRWGILWWTIQVFLTRTKAILTLTNTPIIFPPAPHPFCDVFAYVSSLRSQDKGIFYGVYTSCFASYNVLNNARWVLASVADPWKVSARSLQSCGHTVKRKLCQHRLTKQQQLYFLNIEGKKPSFDRSMCRALQYSG